MRCDAGPDDREEEGFDSGNERKSVDTGCGRRGAKKFAVGIVDAEETPGLTQWRGIGDKLRKRRTGKVPDKAVGLQVPHCPPVLIPQESVRKSVSLLQLLLPFVCELSLQIRSKLINQMVNHTEGNAHPHPGKCLADPAFLLRVIRVVQGTGRQPSKQTLPVKRLALGVGIRYYRPDVRVRFCAPLLRFQNVVRGRS